MMDLLEYWRKIVGNGGVGEVLGRVCWEWWNCWGGTFGVGGLDGVLEKNFLIMKEGSVVCWMDRGGRDGMDMKNGTQRKIN